MSIPVAFNDIGKVTKDLLGKDYIIDGIKIEAKTSASDGATFKVNGQRDTKTGITIGDIETKYVDKQNGLAFTEAWTTSNVLNGKIELENNLTKGLKLELITSYVPITHGKSAKLNAVYKQPNNHTVATVDLSKSLLNLNSVIGHEGWLVGAEMTYNAKLARVDNYNAAIGYSARQSSVALYATHSFTRYAASYYHRLDSQTEATGRVQWDPAINSLGLEIGTKVLLDSTAFIKAKVANTGIVGLSYTQLIRPGVKANLGLAVNPVRLHENAHKVGLGLTFEG